MTRINAVINNASFRRLLKEIDESERDREFCRHGMEHLLSVARIMRIKALENSLDIDKEIMYAAALLHDIGRAQAYRCGVRHEAASADIARDILPKCGFDARETELIAEAVASHNGDDGSVLANLLRTGDRLSRCCFMCASRERCYWSEDKKNSGVEA